MLRSPVPLNFSYIFKAEYLIELYGLRLSSLKCSVLLTIFILKMFERSLAYFIVAKPGKHCEKIA